MDTYVHYYYLNKFFCWHKRKHRKANLYTGSGGGLAGTEIYCSKCWRKHTAVYFDPRKAV